MRESSTDAREVAQFEATLLYAINVSESRLRRSLLSDVVGDRVEVAKRPP